MVNRLHIFLFLGAHGKRNREGQNIFSPLGGQARSVFDAKYIYTYCWLLEVHASTCEQILENYGACKRERDAKTKRDKDGYIYIRY
jgi:hypothetical protein